MVWVIPQQLLKVRLPCGYIATEDSDCLFLLSPEGETIAVFNSRFVILDEVEKAAWEHQANARRP